MSLALPHLCAYCSHILNVTNLEYIEDLYNIKFLNVGTVKAANIHSQISGIENEIAMSESGLNISIKGV